ncbi:MAG: hypothetical protein R3Y11_09365 [Pseudomonadota bacterium]
MKLYLHIGTEKTGTTTIQEALYRNQEALHDVGFHFLQCAGKKNNRAIPSYCFANDHYDDFFKSKKIYTIEQKKCFKSALKALLDDEIKNLPSYIHSVIISSEHFHSRTNTNEEIENVFSLLSQYFAETKVICYLREQAEVSTSHYSTYIKSGHTISFVEHIKRCTSANIYYNYHAMLTNWAKVFGKKNLIVRLFDKKAFVNGDLLDDFFTSIDPSLLQSINKDIPRQNESLTELGQLIGRAANSTFSIYDKNGAPHPLRETVFRAITNEFKGKGKQISLAEYDSIYNEFKESNALLSKEYFNMKKGETCFPYNPPAQTIQPYQLGEDDIERIEKVLLSIVPPKELSFQSKTIRRAALKVDKLFYTWKTTIKKMRKSKL